MCLPPYLVCVPFGCSAYRSIFFPRRPLFYFSFSLSFEAKREVLGACLCACMYGMCVCVCVLGLPRKQIDPGKHHHQREEMDEESIRTSSIFRLVCLVLIRSYTHGRIWLTVLFLQSPCFALLTFTFSKNLAILVWLLQTLATNFVEKLVIKGPLINVKRK